MNNSDIFKLLLIILLIINSGNNNNCDNNTCDNNTCDNCLITNINQIIIAMLLINPPANNGTPLGDTTFET